jgi:uncharacterized membrane protein YccC
MPAGDARARLLPVLQGRIDRLFRRRRPIHALLRGEIEPLPLTPAQLQAFVAPEGWPLRALRPHFRRDSLVLRHAVRMSLALATAYYLGLALPWAGAPVLAGAERRRRPARQPRRHAGAAQRARPRHGARLPSRRRPLARAVGRVPERHLPRRAGDGARLRHPALLGHLDGGERDGAAAVAPRRPGRRLRLRRADRRHLPRRGAGVVLQLRAAVVGAAQRPGGDQPAMRDLLDYATHSLRAGSGDAVDERLARRQAYESLAALGAALQRSRVEPRGVRLPVKQVAALLDHGERFMAHLSLVRHSLARLDDAAELARIESALAAALRDIAACLGPDDTPCAAPAVSDEAAAELELLPAQPPAHDVVPWLQRRLLQLVDEATHIRAAALASLPA